MEAYLAQRKAEGLAPLTIQDYRQRLERLAGFLARKGVLRWQNMKPPDMDAFLASLKRSGLAWSNRVGILIAVRSFLRWLAEHGKILSNPSRHLVLPRPNKDDLPLPEPPLSEEDVAELFSSFPRRNALDLRNIAHLELLYSAGLRLSESLSLNLRDVDLTNRIVFVRNGKGGRPRELPIMRGLYSALRNYLALRRSLLRGPDMGALLVNQRGKRLNKGAFEQVIIRLNRRRGPKMRHLHAHLFRHSIAVHLMRGGADIRYVQAFLGHESLDTTKTYLRLVPVDLRHAYDQAMPEVAVNAV